MHIFLQMPSNERRRPRRGVRTRPVSAAPRVARPARSERTAEDGFLLVEVLVSVLMVALIVVATFNGFDVAGKTAADERFRDQATLLAAQSQEQLRSEPAGALDALESTAHKYTKTLGGTTYTVTQEAKPVGASGNTTGCSVTQSSAQTAANFQVSSTVTWPTQVSAKRPAVVQSSVITPPTGSGIEVDVVNGSGEGVAGVTARATYTPVGSGAQNTIEGTTGSAGCVVLAGIQSTLATVTIVEKTGFVTPSGALTVPPKELTVAPSITTHYEVKYAEAGRIAAHFTYKGATSWEGLEVKSDTFLAGNPENMKVPPEYEIGSTAFASCEGSEELSKAVTGTYLATSETAACTRYPHGDLFPFSNPWVVYGGDCEANKNSEGTASALVTSGNTTTVAVPLSYTRLSAYTGSSSASEGEVTTEALGPVKITNSGCASAPIPNNSWGFAYTHEQKETLPGGHLANPFQPFGKFTLCLVDTHVTPNKRFTWSSTDSSVANPEKRFYLGQKTVTQQSEQRTAEKTAEEKVNNEEAAAKTAKETRASEETAAKTAKEKRATEETAATTAKEKRAKEESEMATAKTAREKKEKEEREKWASEESSKKISKATRENDEKTQTTNRKTKETEEATAKSKRSTEETEATKAKEKRATEETAATTAKEKRAKEESEAGPAKEAREKLKKELETTKKATEAEEAKENASEVTVEAKSTC